MNDEIKPRLEKLDHMMAAIAEVPQFKPGMPVEFYYSELASWAERVRKAASYVSADVTVEIQPLAVEGEVQG